MGLWMRPICFFREHDILREDFESLTVRGGVPSAHMREESDEKDVQSGFDGELSSRREGRQGWVHAIRERLARGGFFALAVFFIVGLLFGVAAKTLASRSITLGYRDYTVSDRDRSAVDLNAVQKRLLSRQEEEMKKQQEAREGSEPTAPDSGGASSGELPPPPPAPEPPLPPESQ